MHSEAGLSFLRLLSVILALGFSTLVLAFIRRVFGGWASDAAMGKGAMLSLLCILMALVFGAIVNVWAALAHVAMAKVWFEAFISAALCEETARFIVLMLLAKGLVTDDPREFVAGAAAVGLGFGVIENLLYITGSSQFLALGALRGVMSAPAHLSFSMLSAYGIWAAFRRDEGPLVLGLFFCLAILLHGFFDVTLMSWPTDADTIKTFLTMKNLGFGLGIFFVTALTAVASLLVLSEFHDWSEHHNAHNANTRRSLSFLWSKIGDSILMVAGFIACSPIGIGLVHSGTTAVALAPMLLGSATSLALWSMAFTQMSRA